MPIPDDMCSLTRDGEICIDYRPVSEIMLRIKSWKNGMGVKVWQDKEWRKFNIDPGLALIRVADDLDGIQLVSRYVNKISKEVRNAVEDIRYHQFPVLQYSSELPAFRDLLVSTPLLAWLLASRSISECWSVSHFNNLLEHKQPEILYGVAGVSNWADIKFLRKVRLLNGTYQEQDVIRNALRNAGLKQKHQAPSCRAGGIAIGLA